jgi:hypothetical protein
MNRNPEVKVQLPAPNDIIRANEKSAETMKAMKLIRWAAMGLSVLLAVSSSAAATSPWEQPAAALAEQIAGILGPGPGFRVRMCLRFANCWNRI